MLAGMNVSKNARRKARRYNAMHEQAEYLLSGQGQGYANLPLPEQTKQAAQWSRMSQSKRVLHGINR